MFTCFYGYMLYFNVTLLLWLQTVAEEKFCILFSSDFNVGGNELKFQVWVSRPSAAAASCCCLHFLSSVFYFLLSVFYFLSAVFYFMSSVFYFLSSVFYFLSSVFYFLSAVFYFMSSVFYFLSSVFYFLMSIDPLRNSVYTGFSQITLGTIIL